MSNMESIMQELEELRKGGHVDDIPFVSQAEGPKKDVSNIVFVDNLPRVEKDRVEKLIGFTRKTFEKIGEIAPDGYVVPLNPETGGNLGFALVTYRSREVAESAVLSLDGLRFDAKHSFRVLRLDEYLELQRLLDSGAGPAQAPLLRRAPHEDDHYWLHDEQCRDEFLLRFSLTDATVAAAKAAKEQHETEVLWADTRGAPLLDYGGESQKAARKVGAVYQQGCWADRYVAWSPRGTYLTTMHDQGAKLWHGKGFRSEGWQEGLASFRLDHAGVNAILWSPNERYVCTWNGRAGNPAPERAFVVWDLFTGLECKAFRQADSTEDGHGFVWSPDSAFLARIVSEVGEAAAAGSAGASAASSGPSGSVQELIHVYAAPTFRLVEDRSIPAPGARDLAWAPRKHNVLSWWTREHDNIPATVSLMRLPSKEYAKQRPLISVEHCSIAWHPAGELCAVYAEKLTKVALSKKRMEAELQKGGAAAAAERERQAEKAERAAAAARAAAGGGEEGGAGGAEGKRQAPGAFAEAICAGYQLEVFRCKGKGDTPVDTLELKDRVLAFAWEPTGARFAVVLESKSFEKYEEPADNPRHAPRQRTRTITAWRVAFYTLAERPGEIVHSHSFELRRDSYPVPTGLHWSPKGDVLVMSQLSGVRTATGAQGNGWLLFYDANLRRELAQGNHEGASELAWDPSGRMLASLRTRPLAGPLSSRDSVSNGYMLWSMQGKCLHEAGKPKLFQFLWRPRWEGLLSEEEARACAKDLRRHISRYQEEDRSKLNRRALLARLRKLQARKEHRAFVVERQAEWEERAEEREERGLGVAQVGGGGAGGEEGGEGGEGGQGGQEGAGGEVGEEVTIVKEVLLTETVTAVKFTN